MKSQHLKSARLSPKRRPLSMGRSTNLVWTILPSIAIVAALFVGFSYISYFVREYMGDYLAREKVMVRSIDGVVPRPKPYVEQAPPPSPESVVEEIERKIRAERLARGELTPILEPVYEPGEEPETPIELIPVEVSPLEVPGLGEEGKQ